MSGEIPENKKTGVIETALELKRSETEAADGWIRPSAERIEEKTGVPKHRWTELLEKNPEQLLEEKNQTTNPEKGVPEAVQKTVNSAKLREKWDSAEKFSEIEGELEEVVNNYRVWSGNDYEKVMHRWEPNISFEETEEFFKQLKTGAKEILDTIPEEKIRSIWKEIEEGIDKNRTLSEALEEQNHSSKQFQELIAHYMFGGNPVEMPVRIGSSGMEYGNGFISPLQTYDNRWWAKSGDGTAHEFGHTLLRQNLSQEKAFLPEGEPPSEVVDEANARFWQNFIYRTQDFWEFFGPIAEEYGIENDHEDIYKAFNAIDPENTERVPADPITYPLHVTIRYEIERDLINGDIEVSEVPGIWDEKLHDYIGSKLDVSKQEIRDLSDEKKSLADVHHGKGKFGYFPFYSMGDSLAAELGEEMNEDLEREITEYISEGDFEPIKNWLDQNIHRYGRNYDEQLKQKEIRAQPLLDHMQKVKDEIYGS